MKKITIAYFVIFAAIILMIWNITDLDVNNLKNGPFSGLISNIFLIVAMIVTIRDLKKAERKY